MSSISGKEKLKKQLIDAHGKIVYTFTAHWKIVDRLKKQFTRIKIVQILLTAASAVGIFTSLIAKIPSLGWLGGIAAFLSLSINLYMLNFNLPDDIKNHTDAANELWDIRESYTSLLTDFDDLDIDVIRNQRDKLTERVSHVNKKYPGTDSKSYKATQKALKEEEEQTFNEGEAERLLHSGIDSDNSNE